MGAPTSARASSAILASALFGTYSVKAMASSQLISVPVISAAPFATSTTRSNSGRSWLTNGLRTSYRTVARSCTTFGAVPPASM